MTFTGWASRVVVVVVYLVIAMVLRKILLRVMKGVSRKSATSWDDVTVAALKGPSMLLVLVSAGWVAIEVAAVPVAERATFNQAIRVGVILAVLWFVDRFVRAAIDMNQERLEEVHLTGGVAQSLARFLVLTIGGLIVLDTLHISITPLLASFGVGGLAIGLALQTTLSNLFAGMQIVSDKPIRLGDFVKLDSGEEGYVTEIGWRTTRIRTLPNNTVVIPNSKLAGSTLTNYYLPSTEVAVLVQVGVSYGSDLAQVERVTIEVAREIQKELPGAIPDFVPFIRYHTFDSSSINFSVIMRGKEFVENYLMKHEFIKRLHSRYQQEGIVIPFPIRTLDFPEAVIDKLRSN